MFDGTFQFVKAVELLAVNFILQIAPQEEVKGGGSDQDYALAI